MTPPPRIALVLLAGHLAAFAVVVVRLIAGSFDVTTAALAGAYGVFVAGASFACFGSNWRRPREVPSLLLKPREESGPTGELARWVDLRTVEALAGRIERLGASRDDLHEALREASHMLRREALRPHTADRLVFELPEDTPEEPRPAAEVRTEQTAKPDAMVLLHVDPVRSETRTEGEPDRVVFVSRGRLTSRARVMIQKLGNRLRRDTGDRED